MSTNGYGGAIVEGAAAGAIATLAMSAVMFAGRRVGLMSRMPPERVTEHALERLDIHPSSRLQDGAASVLHVGFGTAAGAAFGPALCRLAPPVPPVVLGVLYGTMVWAVSYQGWIPAMGIMPRPEDDEPGRPATMIAAHWVYGAVTALLLQYRVLRRVREG